MRSQNCRISIYNKREMNNRINWDDLELHKRFPEKWYKTMIEIQRIKYTAQRDAKRRGRTEFSVDRSGSVEEEFRDIRHSPERKRSPKKKRNECRHPYTTISYGHKVCITCGLWLRRKKLYLVPEEGYEERLTFRKPETDLHSEIVSIFESLIRRLSHPSITVENYFRMVSHHD